jgi:hypothetical protein
MGDVDRIAPPIPTLPPPTGRNVGGQRRRTPERDGLAREHEPPSGPQSPETPSDHIDEYA